MVLGGSLYIFQHVAHRHYYYYSFFHTSSIHEEYKENYPKGGLWPWLHSESPWPSYPKSSSILPHSQTPCSPSCITCWWSPSCPFDPSIKELECALSCSFSATIEAVLPLRLHNILEKGCHFQSNKRSEIYSCLWPSVYFLYIFNTLKCSRISVST